MENKKFIKSIKIDDDLINSINEFAEKENRAFANAANRLIRLGLEKGN